ncbi:MAG: Ig-like domain-containing protein [Nocardioidaceae bacterium]|nr:Ig-like domain-containing protein [Nocardioidaceae bacterium]MCL2614949.1 Ig-like domain-containing protein [Nocardioidaceae bacterium]
MKVIVRGAVLALLLALGVGTVPAHADPDSPVTMEDQVTMYTGGFAELNVLANDTDPTGGSLAVCGLAGVPRALFAEAEVIGNGKVAIGSNGKAGTFSFTYYACDFQSGYNSAGTVTVTVKAKPPMHVRVAKRLQHPGTLQIANQSGIPIFVEWGSYKASKPDAMARIAPHGSRVVHVRRTSLVWVAVAVNKKYQDFRAGIVRGIKLPKNVKALPPGAPPKAGKGPQASSALPPPRAVAGRAALRWAIRASR